MSKPTDDVSAVPFRSHVLQVKTVHLTNLLQILTKVHANTQILYQDDEIQHTSNNLLTRKY